MITLSLLENSTKGFSDLFLTNALVQNKDWFKNPLPFKVEYYLAASTKKLFFGAKIFRKEIWKFNYKKKAFKEGLFKRDVVELFISKKAEPKYLEINLDPNGAYWAKEFTSYRKRSRNKVERDSISTFASLNSKFWQVGLSIDLAAIPFKIKSIKNLQLNICGIFGRNRRYYLSYNIPSSEKPDFHQRVLIKKIKLSTQKHGSRSKRRNS